MLNFLKKYWLEIGTLLLILFLCGKVFGEDFKGEYYEKDGCIYLTGNLTEEEKQADLVNYKQRMAKRARQIESEGQRNHELEIEKIKAQAMRDYLIAQTMPLREVADALGKLKIRQTVVTGDITNTSSSSSEGGNVSNTNISTNANTNTLTGGTSTHNDY